MQPRTRILALKTAVWALGLYPLARVGWWLQDGLYGLGANPIERLLHHTGWWALTLILVALAVTPIRRVTGRNELIKLRRPLGLFGFFYATLHFAIYLGVDQFFALDIIIEDVLERPFITVGFLGWLLLIPLALTSTKASIRRLGKRWTLLHRLVYVVAALGVIHFYWRVKADTQLPLAFAAVFVALMALRMRWTARPARARAARAAEERDARAAGGVVRSPAPARRSARAEAEVV